MLSMTSDTLTLAAEALHNSNVLLKALTRPSDDIAVATINGNDEALAAITGEQSRVPPDREALARRLEERSYHVRTTQDTALLREAAAILRLPAREEWRPIETAPKDGTKFLATLQVFHSETRKFLRRDTHLLWIDSETGEIDLDADQGWSFTDYELWQPLPALPIEETPR